MGFYLPSTWPCSVCHKKCDVFTIRSFVGRKICTSVYCRATAEVFYQHRRSDTRDGLSGKWLNVWFDLQSVLSRWKDSDRIKSLFGYRGIPDAEQYVVDLMQSIAENNRIWAVYNSPTHLDVRNRLRRIIMKFWRIDQDSLLPLPKAAVPLFPLLSTRGKDIGRGSQRV